MSETKQIPIQRSYIKLRIPKQTKCQGKSPRNSIECTSIGCNYISPSKSKAAHCRSPRYSKTKYVTSITPEIIGQISREYNISNEEVISRLEKVNVEKTSKGSKYTTTPYISLSESRPISSFHAEPSTISTIASSFHAEPSTIIPPSVSSSVPTHLGKCLPQYKNKGIIFETIKQLGEGGSGIACLVLVNSPDLRSVELKQIVIKILPKNINSHDVVMREAKILENIKNSRNGCRKYLICFVDFWDSEDNYYIATEYLGPEYVSMYNLMNILTSPEDRWKMLDKLLPEIVRGLNVIHSNDIYHGDLNLSNIMVNPVTGQIKYIDFGFSCIKEECWSSGSFHDIAYDIIRGAKGAGKVEEIKSISEIEEIKNAEEMMNLLKLDDRRNLAKFMAQFLHGRSNEEEAKYRRLIGGELKSLELPVEFRTRYPKTAKVLDKLFSISDHNYILNVPAYDLEFKWKPNLNRDEFNKVIKLLSECLPGSNTSTINNLPGISYWYESDEDVKNNIKAFLTITGYKEPSHALIQNVCVSPDARGQKLAGQLIQDAIISYVNYWKSLGFKVEQALLDVDEKNTNARKVYERLGFRVIVPMRSKKGYLQMVLDITSPIIVEEKINEEEKKEIKTLESKCKVIDEIMKYPIPDQSSSDIDELISDALALYENLIAFPYAVANFILDHTINACPAGLLSFTIDLTTQQIIISETPSLKLITKCLESGKPFYMFLINKFKRRPTDEYLFEHNNLILFLPDRKEYEWFEPIGAHEQFIGEYDLIRQGLKSYLAKLGEIKTPGLQEYKLIEGEQVCPYLGLQTFETESFCSAWSGLYAAIRLLCPNIPRQDVVKEILKLGGKDMRLLVVKWINLLYDYAERKFGKIIYEINRDKMFKEAGKEGKYSPEKMEEIEYMLYTGNVKGAEGLLT